MMGRKVTCAGCGGTPMESSTLCVDCLAACDIGVMYLKGELRKSKYQLRLTRRILRHIFHEYQDLQKLKAVDIVAGENARGREKINA